MRIVQITVVPEVNVLEVSVLVLLGGLVKIAPNKQHVQMTVAAMVNAKNQQEHVNVTLDIQVMIAKFAPELLVINVQMIVVEMVIVIKEYVNVLINIKAMTVVKKKKNNVQITVVKKVTVISRQELVHATKVGKELTAVHKLVMEEVVAEVVIVRTKEVKELVVVGKKLDTVTQLNIKTI